ncbi:ESX secretion-associated protein EspG [Mycolicibacterium arenosum]|uniref:ESX secretion-associated protein EspG n=1 Tax=Mycolicibacterium arenosum TaxID=2952157 RepID=A0ABT1LYG1_9MYCO|nr:ESX secretion-associated protein EspG [Mycolicibacterium sp. CAU 1645]MCP9271552.1 ESX secretion-associated protein EspG [Mycolicibacterium sp. CAU 1645]
MSGPSRRRVGSIDLTDVDILSRNFGRDFLPYPLMFTRPTRFPTADAYAEYAATVADRLAEGDLQKFEKWAASYAYADIRVECHVQFIPADTPSIRVVANRLGDNGFLAQQRGGDDVDVDTIDVDELSAYQLSAAIADLVAFTKPGRRARIVVPEYVRQAVAVPEPRDFSVHDTVVDTGVETVARSDIAAYGTVQSHWRPLRRWGFDAGKNAAVFLRVRGDGDYLYEDADLTAARPMDRRALAERIDRLIAEDVAVLRRVRRG